ncbi:TonB-dependent receptor plug domain-containing protein [Sphingomonas morindae]
MMGAAIAALLPAAALAQQSSPKAPATTPNIVVTASPFGTDTATIVAKVDRNTILATGGSNIADSLQNVPGISATNFASGASRPIIRGMDANRVRLLEDGSSSSDVSDIGPDHGVPIDPLSAQSIEVVRGPATLRYGSQAIGGVVNVLNNRVPTVMPTQPVQGEINSSYNTVNNGAEISGLADVNAGGGFALHADAFYRYTDNYDTPLGTQQNSYFHGDGLSGGASYFTGDTQLGAAITHYDADYGIPSDTTHIVMHQTKGITRDHIDISSGALKALDVWGSYADYQHQEVEPDGEVDTTFKNKEWDGRTELTLNPIGPISNIAVGAEVQRRRFSALGVDSSYLFPTLTQSEAGYIFAEMPLTTRLRLQAAGRVEHTQINGTPADDVFNKARFTPVSGSLGALFDLTSTVKLGLTGSSTGRAPAQTELYARGGHDGPNTFETGDPNLKVERANSLEGTIRVNSGKFRFEGSAYYTWFHNYIYGDLTGRTCDDDGNCVDGDGEELRELNYRQGGARFRGLEGQASYALLNTAGGGKFELNALGDYTRATLTQGGNVPRIPPYRVGGGFTFTSKMADASLLYLYVGRQNKFGAFDTPTPHYNQLNAQIALRPFKAYPGIQLAVVGQNLTNDVQRAATALNKDEVVLPGRNVRFVLKFANF